MPTVLVIEDDPATCDVMRMMLKPLGAKVVIQQMIHDIKQLVHEIQPDVIIMDLFLPEPSLDGWAATQQLKTDDQTNQIPIIIVSAAGSAREEQAAYQAGCDVFLRKPVHPHDLRYYLESYIT